MREGVEVVGVEEEVPDVDAVELEEPSANASVTP
jgi:hypothetical protein